MLMQKTCKEGIIKTFNSCDNNHNILYILVNVSVLKNDDSGEVIDNKNIMQKYSLCTLAAVLNAFHGIPEAAGVRHL